MRHIPIMTTDGMISWMHFKTHLGGMMKNVVSQRQLHSLNYGSADTENLTLIQRLPNTTEREIQLEDNGRQYLISTFDGMRWSNLSTEQRRLRIDPLFVEYCYQNPEGDYLHATAEGDTYSQNFQINREIVADIIRQYGTVDKNGEPCAYFELFTDNDTVDEDAHSNITVTCRDIMQCQWHRIMLCTRPTSESNGR